jgi:hypothetical protein
MCNGTVVGVVDMREPDLAVGACEQGDFTVYEEP